MPPSAPPPASVSPYQFFVLVLSLGAIASLAVEGAVEIGGEARTVLDYADNAVCALFFLDFLLNLRAAPNRWRYLVTWGWIDLLSSVPAVDALRWGRAARVFRILRVLRAVKSTRIVAGLIIAQRRQSAFLAAVLLAVLLLIVSSLAMLRFEAGAGGSIRTAQDAMWWAMATMTTVGYGDTYPVTPEGRLVAVFLMIAGIGVFGTFSGLVASWFLSPQSAAATSELDEIRAAVADLQRRLPEAGAPGAAGRPHEPAAPS